MSNPIHDFFADVPFRNILPIKMNEPNEHIEVYSGAFILRYEEKEYQVDGKIFFKWFPDMGIRFNGNTHIPISIFDQFDEADLVIDGNTLGKTIITHWDSGENVLELFIEFSKCTYCLKNKI